VVGGGGGGGGVGGVGGGLGGGGWGWGGGGEVRFSSLEILIKLRLSYFLIDRRRRGLRGAIAPTNVRRGPLIKPSLKE